jgi:hypothetical protein
VRIGPAGMGAGTGAVAPGVGPRGVIVPRRWVEVVVLGVEILGIGPLGVIVLVVLLVVVVGGAGVLVGAGGPLGVLIRTGDRLGYRWGPVTCSGY